MASAASGLVGGVVAASTAAVARAVGRDTEGPVPTGRDARFADPAWEQNAGYWYLRQLHLLRDRFVGEVIDAAPIDGHARTKATLAASILSDTLAPTNTLLGNPAALQRAFQTGGLSLVRGARNAASRPGQERRVALAGRPPPVRGGREHRPARPGRSSTATSCSSCSSTSRRPSSCTRCRCSSARRGSTSTTSWTSRPSAAWWSGRSATGTPASPSATAILTESMRDATFDDYLLERAARRRSRSSARSPGRTWSTRWPSAWAARSARWAWPTTPRSVERTVNSATLINTHTDFTRPGVLGAFADEGTDRTARAPHGEGRPAALEAASPARSPSAGPTTWSSATWSRTGCMGETPPAFDLLAWNDDGTNMPGKMHGDFLRWFYLENRLAEGRMEIDGTRLDLSSVDQPTYVVSAIDDHIVPVGLGLRDHATARRRRQPLRALHRRPHRRHRRPRRARRRSTGPTPT